MADCNIEVAVGLVQNNKKEFLITQRPYGKDHAAYWEFPGGKLEQNESAADALSRELKEELNIDTLSSIYLDKVVHSYLEKKVSLLVFQIRSFKGEPKCMEGQLALEWVKFSELKQFSFPEANQNLIHLIETQFPQIIC